MRDRSRDSQLLDIYLFFKTAADVFKGRYVPDFIRNYDKIQNSSKIKKVFKSFGLSSFREPFIPNPEKMAAEYVKLATDCVEALGEEVQAVANGFRTIINQLMRQLDDNEDMPQDDRALITKEAYELDGVEMFLRQVAVNMIHAPERFLSRQEGKLKLLFPANIQAPDSRFRINMGESVFRAYNKIHQYTTNIRAKYNLPREGLALTPSDNVQGVKKFNSFNLTSSRYEIVFSGDEDAPYDIASMSERGIASCQSWAKGSARGCLIGSILSRYVGIIYLTTGADWMGRGEQMIKRCVVRFGLNLKTKSPVIILDRMYTDYNPDIGEAFVRALQQRTKLPVLNLANRDVAAQLEKYDLHEREVVLPGEKFPDLEQSSEIDEQPEKPARTYIDGPLQELIKEKDDPIDKVRQENTNKERRYIHYTNSAIDHIYATFRKEDIYKTYQIEPDVNSILSYVKNTAYHRLFTPNITAEHLYRKFLWKVATLTEEKIRELYMIFHHNHPMTTHGQKDLDAIITAWNTIIRDAATELLKKNLKE